MPQHPASVKLFLPDCQKTKNKTPCNIKTSAPSVRALFFLVLFASLALFGSLAHGSQTPPEARIQVEYFRQDQKPLALARLELPAGSYAFAHEPGAAVKPAELVLRDAQGRQLPVLYPAGKEIYSPGVNGPVRAYVSGDALFVPLDAPAGSVFVGELSLALCTAEICTFHTLDTRLRVPEGSLPDLSASQAQAYAAARPGRIASEAVSSPLPVQSLPLLSLSGQASRSAPAPPPPEVWNFQPQVFHPSLEVDGLASALLLGLLAGLILNAMPCVLPVLALKACALLRAGGAAQAARMREHMLLSAAGILSWFQLLALLLGGSGLIWGQLFQQSALTYGLLALVFALGLSMLGVFDLPLIDLKAGNTNSPRLQAYFAGFLATLLATPCSGPLLGGVLAWAFSRNALWPVFTAVGIGMALPYLLIALRPGLARFLPRPGAWLEILERLVGFFLMGLTVYLIFLLPGERRMPALASLPLIALAAWIWGAYCGPGVSARRLRALGGLALGLIAAAGLLGLQTTAENAEWENFTPQEFRATLGNTPQVLVFTADWCPNCKALEHAVLSAGQMRAWQKRYGARFVRVDLTRENAPALALLRALGSSSIPFVAFFPAGEKARTPLVLRDMYTSGQFEEALARGFAKP